MLTFYVNSSINSNVVLYIREKRSRIHHLKNKFSIAPYRRGTLKVTKQDIPVSSQ